MACLLAIGKPLVGRQDKKLFFFQALFGEFEVGGMPFGRMQASGRETRQEASFLEHCFGSWKWVACLLAACKPLVGRQDKKLLF